MIMSILQTDSYLFEIMLLLTEIKWIGALKTRVLVAPVLEIEVKVFKDFFSTSSLPHHPMSTKNYLKKNKHTTHASTFTLRTLA